VLIVGLLLLQKLLLKFLLQLFQALLEFALLCFELGLVFDSGVVSGNRELCPKELEVFFIFGFCFCCITLLDLSFELLDKSGGHDGLDVHQNGEEENGVGCCWRLNTVEVKAQRRDERIH
jgi:hypothetical protein